MNKILFASALIIFSLLGCCNNETNNNETNNKIPTIEDKNLIAYNIPKNASVINSR